MNEELSQLATYKRENEQLRRSLEEAHRELRTMQDGGTVDNIQVNAELKSLLQRTYRIEKGIFLKNFLRSCPKFF